MCPDWVRDVGCEAADSWEPTDASFGAPTGLALASEPALLLEGEDEDEEAPEPSAPVPSAWATPDPLARAAPTPRVIAPAPSQP